MDMIEYGCISIKENIYYIAGRNGFLSTKKVSAELTVLIYNL